MINIVYIGITGNFHYLMYHDVLIAVEWHVSVLLNFVLCVCWSVFTMMFTYFYIITMSQERILTFIAVTNLHNFLTLKILIEILLFTAWCYASAVLAMGLCLCLSVTSRSSTKTAKQRITQTTPDDSAGTLVFWCQRSPRNSTGVTPYKGAECRWSGSKSATFNK